jgi:hypothetical protein
MSNWLHYLSTASIVDIPHLSLCMSMRPSIHLTQITDTTNQSFQLLAKLSLQVLQLLTCAHLAHLILSKQLHQSYQYQS